MIHLDTNCLIELVSTPSPTRTKLLRLLAAGEEFEVSVVTWSEFLTGPIQPHQVKDAHKIIQGRILPFGVPEAELAAGLFNHAGRRRGSRPDCFIAASAICANVPLATENRKDFVRFSAMGLRLV